MLVTNELINAAKMARRMNTDAFDSEVERLLYAALLDLGCAGVVLPEESTALAEQAAITYFLANFGEPDRYDDLKRSYDEQKAQLRTRTGYTVWTVTDTAAVDPGPENTTYMIEIVDGVVQNDASDVLEAFDSGKTVNVTADGVVSYLQWADGSDSEKVVLHYPQMIIRVERSGSVEVLSRTFDIHVTEPSYHGEITERSTAILAAFNAGQELRLIEGDCIMTADSYSMTNDDLVVSFRSSTRLYQLSASAARLQLYTEKPDTSDRSVWLHNNNNG